MNAAVDGTDIVYRGRFDIGVAVDTPEGLIVPVVKGADQLSLLELSTGWRSWLQRPRTAVWMRPLCRSHLHRVEHRCRRRKFWHTDHPARHVGHPLGGDGRPPRPSSKARRSRRRRSCRCRCPTITASSTGRRVDASPRCSSRTSKSPPSSSPSGRVNSPKPTASDGISITARGVSDQSSKAATNPVRMSDTVTPWLGDAGEQVLVLRPRGGLPALSA